MAGAPNVEEENRLLRALSERPGREGAIGSGALFQAVFGKPCRDKIRDTRRLRDLITMLRNDGCPICSSSDPERGGYYLASSGPELADHCARIHARAMRLLVMEAKLRKMALPELLGQISAALARD